MEAITELLSRRRRKAPRLSPAGGEVVPVVAPVPTDIVVSEPAPEPASRISRPDEATRRLRKVRKRELKYGIRSKTTVAAKLESARAAKKEKARTAKEERTRAQQAMRMETVAGVFNSALGTTVGDTLTPELTNVTVRGVDRRTWTYDGVMRKVFKQTTTAGDTFCTSLFGDTESVKGNNVAHLCVADTILREQRQNVRQRIKTGGGMFALHWELDATPQEITLTDPKAVARLNNTSVPPEDVQPGDGSREVLVQRGRVTIDGWTEDLFSRPRILGDECSGTVLDVLFSEMLECGIDVEEAAGGFEQVFLDFGIDGGANMDLTIEYIKQLLLGFPNVSVTTTYCLMHSLNRITADHAEKSRFELGGLFSITKLMHISKHWENFGDAVVAEAASDIDWHRFEEPPADAKEMQRVIMDATRPDIRRHPRCVERVASGLRVINGRVNQRGVPHYCTIDPSTGMPCCENIGQVRKKVKLATRQLLLHSRPPTPATTRWLTVLLCSGWWLLGTIVCSLFPRGWLRAFGGGPRQVPAAAPPADQDHDSDENPQDAFHVRTGKRMRKGTRLMGDKLRALLLAFSTVLLIPLHFLMGILFEESVADDISSEMIVTTINTTMGQLCKLLVGDTLDARGVWSLLHWTESSYADRSSQDVLLYMRTEVLRVIGSLYMRVTSFWDDPAYVVWASLEMSAGGCDVGTVLDYCSVRGCCMSPGNIRFNDWCRDADDESLRVAKRHWAPFILRTERDHAGNQKRQRKKGHRARGARRQVALYINTRAKHHWMRARPGNHRRLKNIAGITRQVFRFRLRRHQDERRSNGSNPLYDYVNGRISDMRRLGLRQYSEWKFHFCVRGGRAWAGRGRCCKIEYIKIIKHIIKATN